MIRNLDWMDSARCIDADPDIFFPEGDHPKYMAARIICRACPVQQTCGDYAEQLEDGAAQSARAGLWADRAPSRRARLASTAHRPARRRRQSEERHSTILRLHLAGWDPALIAEHVGCSERTVWRAVKQYRDQLQEAA